MGVRRSFDEWLSLIEDRTDCWVWPGPLHTGGYGHTGHQRLAHRVSYERHIGPIPVGLEIDHLCRTRLCIRPDHLEAVTPLVNKQRARKSVCKRGHPLNDSTTYKTAKGRSCKECVKAHARAFYWRKKQRLTA